MAQLLKDDFSPKRPPTQVPVAWYNRVAKMLNGLIGGLGINVNKDGAESTEVEIALDPETARQALGVFAPAPNAVSQSGGQGSSAAQIAAKFTPQDVVAPVNNETDAQKIARIGQLNEPARADHKHADRKVFNGSTSIKPNFANMLTCEPSPSGYGHTLSFYPPVVDDSGRITGLAKTPAWTVDLLDDV